MALVILTLSDTEDGAVDISAKSEPFIPGPDSEVEPTPAQQATILMIAAVHEFLSQLAESLEEAEA